MFYMIVPKLGTFKGDTIAEVVDAFENARDTTGVGISDIGSRWIVKDFMGHTAGAISYNGRIWSV